MSGVIISHCSSTLLSVISMKEYIIIVQDLTSTLSCSPLMVHYSQCQAFCDFDCKHIFSKVIRELKKNVITFFFVYLFES